MFVPRVSAETNVITNNKTVAVLPEHSKRDTDSLTELKVQHAGQSATFDKLPWRF